MSFNYLGQFDQALGSEGRFSFARESAGSDVDPNGAMAHALAVNGLIADGALSLSFRLSSELAAQLDAQELVASFAAKLRALLEHCSAADRGATASDFPLARLTQAQLEGLPFRLRQVEDIYPATPIQRGLVFHSLERSEEGLYVYQLRLTLAGTLDLAALREAWEEIARRYDVLRTHFEWRHGGDLLQVVQRSVALPFVVHDWTQSTDYEERLESFRREDVARGFDVMEPPLLRINVFARPDGKHDLLWTMHHAIVDGWSSARIVAEVIDVYRVRISSGAVESQPVIPYRNYIEWLASRPSSEPWWRQSLASLSDPARLLGSIGRPQAQKPGTHHRHDLLPRSLSERLQELAKRCEVTLSTVMQAAWGVVLAATGTGSKQSLGSRSRAVRQSFPARCR